MPDCNALSFRMFCYDSFVAIRVRKAVFPAAGLGTRFLPATKAQPKEMLPLVDKPIIQYGVEEAVASGVDNIILVTGRGKNAIEDHFDVSVELETFLEARGKTRAARGDPQDLEPDQLRVRPAGRAARPRPRRPRDARAGGRRAVCRHPGRRRDRRGAAGGETARGRVRQAERAGAGRRTRPAGGHLELRRHCDRRRRERAPGTGRVSRCAIWSRSRAARKRRRTWRSSAATCSRPDIFPALAATKSDRTGEIQLTNGLRELLKKRPIYACEVQGVRHDTGNKLGFLKAVVYFALKRPDLADRFATYLARLDLPTPAGKRYPRSRFRRSGFDDPVDVGVDRRAARRRAAVELVIGPTPVCRRSNCCRPSRRLAVLATSCRPCPPFDSPCCPTSRSRWRTSRCPSR